MLCWGFWKVKWKQGPWEVRLDGEAVNGSYSFNFSSGSVRVDGQKQVNILEVTGALRAEGNLGGSVGSATLSQFLPHALHGVPRACSYPCCFLCGKCPLST